MSKSIWLIVTMGLISALVLSLAMMMGLSSFKDHASAEWVKLAEQTTNEFKFTNVAVRVSLIGNPTAMKISYHTPLDSKFDLSAQNAEMEKVAQYAAKNYKGRDLNQIDQFQITRSETHGSGCFKQTYVATLNVPNPRRGAIPGGNNPFGAPPPFPPPRDR